MNSKFAYKKEIVNLAKQAKNSECAGGYGIYAGWFSVDPTKFDGIVEEDMVNDIISTMKNISVEDLSDTNRTIEDLYNGVNHRKVEQAYEWVRERV